MNPTLLLDLIDAHFGGDVAFARAVGTLASEVERSGDPEFAAKLRSAARQDESVYETSSVLTAPSIERPVLDRKGPRQSTPLAGRKPRVADVGPETGTVDNILAPRQSRATASNAGRPGQAIPKDRDSALDLYEVVWPQIGLDSLVLPDKPRDALHAIVAEWRKAADLHRHGLHPTRKVLLCGPPGTGKTTAALALAHEMGLPIAYVRLDSLVSSYLGQTSTNLRRIFDSLGSEPVVLFLDEFDAIAKKRDDAQEVGELKRIVITLLQNFDNADPNVLIFAATNHPHLLDPAIWRRFDVAIQLELPGSDQRRRMLERHLEGRAARDFDLDMIAQATAGLSGSQIGDVARMALRRGALADAKTIATDDLLDALLAFHTKFHVDEDAEMRMTKYLRDLRIPWRELARIMRTSVSTLRDRFEKYERDQRGED